VQGQRAGVLVELVLMALILLLAKCVKFDAASAGKGENSVRLGLGFSMPANNPVHADDPGRRRDVYDATIVQAMQAGATDARLDALGAKIDGLAQSMDKRFEQVDRRFESLEDHFALLQRTLIGGGLVVIAALIGILAHV
jgi:hypothetical protein